MFVESKWENLLKLCHLCKEQSSSTAQICIKLNEVGTFEQELSNENHWIKKDFKNVQKSNIKDENYTTII